jgi:hypothetical protein
MPQFLVPAEQRLVEDTPAVADEALDVAKETFRIDGHMMKAVAVVDSTSMLEVAAAVRLEEEVAAEVNEHPKEGVANLK